MLEASHIGRRNRRAATWLLRDVSLSVHSGNRLALVGPSGSGKSLVLRSLALLDTLDEGQILWWDKPVRGQDVPPLRSRVMYMHQRPALVPGTVEDNLRAAFQLKVHRDRRFDRSRTIEFLQQLHRDESFLQQRQVDLSGGESQIAALLRAMQLDPDILLLDEPTAALDAEATVAVETLISQWLNEKPGQRATVCVTHDRAQAQRLADTILTLDNGTIVPEQAST